MRYPIEDIQGFGPASAEKTRTAGITKTGNLLGKCPTPAGRKAIAGQSDLSEAPVLKWTNMADPMLISGVAE